MLPLRRFCKGDGPVQLFATPVQVDPPWAQVLGYSGWQSEQLELELDAWRDCFAAKGGAVLKPSGALETTALMSFCKQ